MTEAPLRVAALGMGWWSDVLADGIKRSNRLEIVACFTRSEEKRNAFAAKYGCRAAAIRGCDPALAFDIDEVHDYRYAVGKARSHDPLLTKAI